MPSSRHGSKTSLFAVATLLLTVPLYAAPSPESILEEAASAINDDYMISWAYTETAEESGTTWIGRYDPRKQADQRWILLSVDGREPESSEIEEYADEKENDGGSQRNDKDHDGLSGMVDPGSLELIEETDQYYLYSFAPSDDDDDVNFMEHVDATVKIVKDGPYIEYIDMHSEKPFRPKFGVKIRDFVTRLGFGPAAPGGPIVPTFIDVRIKVRALLFINVNEKISISYSDYEFVGD